jgi:hypothetical protein
MRRSRGVVDATRSHEVHIKVIFSSIWVWGLPRGSVIVAPFCRFDYHLATPTLMKILIVSLNYSFTLFPLSALEIVRHLPTGLRRGQYESGRILLSMHSAPLKSQLSSWGYDESSRRSQCRFLSLLQSSVLPYKTVPPLSQNLEAWIKLIRGSVR